MPGGCWSAHSRGKVDLVGFSLRPIVEFLARRPVIGAPLLNHSRKRLPRRCSVALVKLSVEDFIWGMVLSVGWCLWFHFICVVVFVSCAVWVHGANLSIASSPVSFSLILGLPGVYGIYKYVSDLQLGSSHCWEHG